MLALHKDPETSFATSSCDTTCSGTHQLCTFFSSTVTLLSVNIFGCFFFQQASIYLPSNFLNSSSTHSLCCVWAMSSSQSIFFCFVPLRTGFSVLESRFPARFPAESMLTVQTHMLQLHHNSWMSMIEKNVHSPRHGFRFSEEGLW